jgi:Mlc titration factor MtfA (ptsG expression regulator)
MIFSTKKYKLATISALVISFTIMLLFFVPVLVTAGPKYGFHVLFFIILGSCALLVFTVTFLFLTRKYRRRNRIVKQKIPPAWEQILSTRVAFYSTLTGEEKETFKRQIQIFLGEKDIIPIETDIDEETRLLIAASAIIPVFGYPEWEYDDLTEILIYPDDFDLNYDFYAKEKNILGLVTGQGSTMVLSKPSLYHGFRIDKDKLNVGFHEFAHKIDGEDGYIDGIPAVIAAKELVKEWLSCIKKESALIREGKSDINPYALTNNAEFFAVASEYFFENPASMAEKHHELYDILMRIFRQDTKSRFAAALKSMFIPYGKKLGRNSPCPCGSGKKYKHCCLKRRK